MDLLSINSSDRTTANTSGYLLAACNLMPHTSSGLGVNLCTSAKECVEPCYYDHGRNKFSNVMNAKKQRTELFVKDREAFLIKLCLELDKASVKAKKLGLGLAVRLNITSDICWETIPVENCKNLMEKYPDAQWYDYTKHFNRWDLPKNYHLTFSRQPSNDKLIELVLSKGRNAAVVFGINKNKKEDGSFLNALPDSWKGHKVIDGDHTDLRFLDKENGVIIGLRSTREALKDNSGFVVK